MANGNSNGKSKYTKPQLVLLNILGDGKPHTRTELKSCCQPGVGANALPMHISLLRKRLRIHAPTVEVVPVKDYPEYAYRLVRVLPATLEHVGPLT